jgi:hypothetical protein
MGWLYSRIHHLLIFYRSVSCKILHNSQTFRIFLSLRIKINLYHFLWGNLSRSYEIWKRRFFLQHPLYAQRACGGLDPHQNFQPCHIKYKKIQNVHPPSSYTDIISNQSDAYYVLCNDLYCWSSCVIFLEGLLPSS